MRRKKKPNRFKIVLISLAGVAITLLLIIQLPPVRQNWEWRKEIAKAYLGGIIHPAGPVPTALPSPPQMIAKPGASPTPVSTPTEYILPTPTTPEPTLTPLPSPTPIPEMVMLASPPWEKQGPNNCGPASLSIYLHYYGWSGTQEDIAQLVKPLTADRNVNPEELVYFVRTHAGWLKAEFRVGGDVELLKRLLAAGFPVLVEESFRFEKPYWPNDDLWAAHYLLLTGYDDRGQVFTGQDSFHGADQKIGYDVLDKEWKIFNRVYLILYLPEQEETLKAVLGDNWNLDLNRQYALDIAQAEAILNPTDAYAWFNLGSNLVYFGRYEEAVEAYDTARSLDLPQRMLRYQFGPFFAYFHAGRTEDLLKLTEYALQRTDNSEEALLWHGWALYRKGETNNAIDDWRKAIKANPGYQDALYALDFVGSNP